MNALTVFAGPTARAHLLRYGLRAQDVSVVPGAAGGPKGLVLNPLDVFLFGQWLRGDRVQHLVGASIGAWRLACACLPEPGKALRRLAEDYIAQRYMVAPGRRPSAAQVSRYFADTLEAHFSGCEQQVLSHPLRRLHVFTSRGAHVLLGRQSRWGTPLGYLGAFCANAVSRRALGGWLERIVFSDHRDPLPLPLTDFPTRQVALTAQNLRASILASCSIPFVLDAVHDIPGAPPGAYWDGGITDYHLHLDYATSVAADDEAQGEGASLVLYPHFQPTVVPGWLDKGLRGRHRATPKLDNVVLLTPSPGWIATLPNGKLPDRRDFSAYGEDEAARQRAWARALAESERLAEEFARLTERDSVQALPLA